MYTIEEAADKSCHVLINKSHDGEVWFDTCIGSDCMAWRWVGGEHLRQRKLVKLGYCGLAGKPE